jgi:hypothetical protein
MVNLLERKVMSFSDTELEKCGAMWSKMCCCRGFRAGMLSVNVGLAAGTHAGISLEWKVLRSGQGEGLQSQGLSRDSER